MSKDKKGTVNSIRKMENVMKEAAFWVKRKKTPLPFLYKGIIERWVLNVTYREISKVIKMLLRLKN